MKSISKLITGFAIMVSMVVFSPAGANAAASPVFGHKYTRGISRVSIYIDSSSYPRASYWEPRIVEAINNWLNTGYGSTQFGRVFVSSSVASQMDWHAAYSSQWGDYGSLVRASTTLYNSEGVNISAYYYDWYYAKITLNDDVLREDRISNTEAVATMIHEMGHAFGLDDNNSNSNSNRYSIMCQTGSGRAVYTVQKPDHDALNSIYY